MKDSVMRISAIQMAQLENRPEENRARAEYLIRRAVETDAPDVLLLPETWNLGFSPHTIDPAQADDDGAETKRLMSRLSRELSVNIVAGSVVNRRGGAYYNTLYAFSRQGELLATYDKTHLFSPMGEDAVFQKGETLARFSLDGVRCAAIICYDLRFPELIRTLALPGLDLLFVVSQWPAVRAEHLSVLSRARAIENQMYLALCNACSLTSGTKFGGGSAIIDPLGNVLARAGDAETVLTADADMAVIADIRARIPVFADRRPALYHTDCDPN